MFGESSGILCPVLCDTREIGVWQFCIEEIDPRVTDMNHKGLSCQPPEGAIFGTAPWGSYLLEVVFQVFIKLRMAYLAEHFCKYLCSVAVCGEFVIVFRMFFAFRLEL
jgi:hypothetical protein